MVGTRDDFRRAAPDLEPDTEDTAGFEDDLAPPSRADVAAAMADLAARDRDPLGVMPLLFVAAVAGVRIVWGLVRHEGPTPTTMGLSLLLVLVGALLLTELVHHLRSDPPLRTRPSLRR